MFKKFVYGVIVLTLVVGLPAFIPTFQVMAAKPAARAISAPLNATMHLMPPRDEVVIDRLTSQGMLPINATQEQKDAAIREFKRQFAKQSHELADPKAQKWIDQIEANPVIDNAILPTPVTAAVFALAVEFDPDPESLTYDVPNEAGDACVEVTESHAGPEQGEILAPGAGDNQTVWYTPAQTADASFYENMIFGYTGAGRVRMDLKDPVDKKPGINLAGVTVQDYYDHQAGAGNVTLQGEVGGWVQVDHSEAYYGAPGCSDGAESTHDGAITPVWQLVIDAATKYKAANPGNDTYEFWSQFDGNGDQVMDTFWLIHAGMGTEAGGGAQGDFSIWSHSSSLPGFWKIYDDADPAKDIYVNPYTVQPENSEVGVFSEEFGHNFFYLPDMYTTDIQGSIGFWAIMEAGAWGGYLGGAQPVGMPLWFKMIAVCGFDGPDPVMCNWHQPMLTRAYDDPPVDLPIGQLEGTPAGTWKGARVNMPAIEVTVENPAGTGNAAYTGKGLDDSEIALTTELAIPSAATNILNFSADWAIEEGWDYAYLQVSEDGTSWTNLDDVDAYMTNDPGAAGQNEGNGLTGTGSGTMSFDLNAYATKTIYVRWLYKTDAAVTENGWFIDDVKLDATPIPDGSFELSSSFDDFSAAWTNGDPGWQIVPNNMAYANYYLVEWRNNTKYDGMVKTAYITLYNDDATNTWKVMRVPYNIPGALLYYRNTYYSNTYSLAGGEADGPSYGPKYQLLLVDMNPLPIMLQRNAAGYVAFNARTSSYDAALTLQPSKKFTIPKSDFLGNTKKVTIPAKKAVKVFDDSKGYYPGFFVGAPCADGSLCFWSRGASAVIPAKDFYSTRVTDIKGKPATGEYGPWFGGHSLGDGNPGNLAWGVNIKLLGKSKSGDRGLLRIWNADNY